MAQNNTRQSSLGTLAPSFRDRLERGLATARRDGLQVHVFESTRTPERQAWLYGQGRSRPGLIVTNAPAGLSWHEYAVAVDLVFDGDAKPGVQWDWDGDFVGGKRGDYQRLGAILRAAGLEWLGAPGSSFPEMAHFQMTGGLTIREARDLRGLHGLAAVWREIERRLSYQNISKGR